MSNSGFMIRTMKRKNVKGLSLTASAEPPAPLTGSSVNVSGTQNTATIETPDSSLEIGTGFSLDLKNSDLIVIKELGHGNGGTVTKVQLAGTGTIMARKIIHVDKDQEVRKRIMRELHIMKDCASPFIVSFYGAFANPHGDVVMCMEYMDSGSLDYISRVDGPVRVDVLGKIAEAVLGGLSYLYNRHRIMHRDIKPSNVLFNSQGQIKLCDFGVSSELNGSVADTFVGTGTYMAPERILGQAYTVKSDVWSVGLTLLELAIGKFPLQGDNESGGAPQGILDLLQRIVLEPPPRLPKSDAFPSVLEDFITKCLMKEPELRPTPMQLYEEDGFILAAKRTPVDLVDWVTSLKSYRQSRVDQGAALAPVHPLAQQTSAQAGSRLSQVGRVDYNAASFAAQQRKPPPPPAYPGARTSYHQPADYQYHQPAFYNNPPIRSTSPSKSRRP